MDQQLRQRTYRQVRDDGTEVQEVHRYMGPELGPESSRFTVHNGKLAESPSTAEEVRSIIEYAHGHSAVNDLSITVPEGANRESYSKALVKSFYKEIGGRPFQLHIPAVKRIELSGFLLTASQLNELMSYLPSNLKVFKMDNCGVSDRHVRILEEFLQSSGCEALLLPNNNIGNQGLRTFSELLAGSSLEKLGLSHNGITDITPLLPPHFDREPASPSFLAFAGSNLQALDLSHNQINKEQMEEFIKGLIDQCKRLDLNLAYTNMSPIGLMALAEYVRHLSPHIINVKGNDMSTTQWAAIQMVLALTDKKQQQCRTSVAPESSQVAAPPISVCLAKMGLNDETARIIGTASIRPGVKMDLSNNRFSPGAVAALRGKMLAAGVVLKIGGQVLSFREIYKSIENGTMPITPAYRLATGRLATGRLATKSNNSSSPTSLIEPLLEGVRLPQLLGIGK